MNKIQIITTTSSIENWDIKNYLGIVTDQIVLGANIFHDVFASFRDVFGGSVKSYQRDLNEMENLIISNLKRKATKLGANIIIGLRLDFDEISGAGKSMFMLSGSGTAAFATSKTNDSFVEEDELIPYTKLGYEIERDQLINKINQNDFRISDISTIQDLHEYNINAIKHVVNFINIYWSMPKKEIEIVIDYFRSVPMDSISEYLIGEEFLSINNQAFLILLDILNDVDWYSFDVLIALLKKKNPIANSRVLYLLNLEKSTYSSKDIQKMIDVFDLIDNTYSVYPILRKSKGLMGKEKEEWKCINCGTVNSKESIQCWNAECLANVYGIPKNKNNPEKVKSILLQKINKLKQLCNLTKK